MDKISVILPVYNVASNLSRCLTSLTSQTYNNLEFILVNDGSTDSSFSICKQFANLDSRFKLINQENAGRGIARNRGIEAATGDYISFVDPDDFVDTHYFEKLHEQVKKYNSDIAICGFLYMQHNNPAECGLLQFHGYDLNNLAGCYSRQDFFENFDKFYFSTLISVTGPCAKIISRKCTNNVFSLAIGT